MDDRALLDEYIRSRSQDSFQQLVERHLPMIYSTARRIVRDAQIAEEVAQDVFSTLAQKAESLRPPQIVGGWLYNTTRYRAMNVVRGEHRRREREQTAFAMQTLDLASDDPRIAEHLEVAMAELDADDRDAVVLRYLESRSLRDVGAEFSISEDAARKRVDRAIERLRAGFERQGVTITTTVLLGTALTATTTAVPVGLAAAITTTAVAGMALQSSTTIVAAKTIAMTTLQKTLVTSAIAALTGFGIYEARQDLSLRTRVQTLQQQHAPLTEQLQQLTRDRDDTMRQLAALRDENERLKRDTAELLRLRGEATRLRQELAQATTKRPASVSPPAPPKEAEQLPEPVQIFVANADAAVPAGQTLAFGGWSTPPGKRTLVFVQPKIVEASSPGRVGSILLECRFLEIPEEALANVILDPSLAGLEKLKADGKASSVHSLFSAEEATLILKTLESTAGVDILSSPRVQTGDGIQAVLSVTEQKMIGGQEHALGPSLDVEPRIAANGSSVNLTVSARLKKAGPTQQKDSP